MSGNALRGIGRILTGIALALLLAYVIQYAVRTRTQQWDTGTYHLAARAALAGLDPYSMEHLSSMAGGKVVFYPFVYPPIGLLPFIGLAMLPLAKALTLWISLKVVLLVGLVLLWRRVAPEIEWLPLAISAVFGFGASALWDLRAGNVGIVEAVLVWLGLAAFVRGKRGAFSAWIIAASCFKLAPAVFLLLWLAPTADRRANLKHFVISGLVLGTLVWGPLWIGPAAHWSGFLSNVSEMFPVGPSNPSILALILTYARPAAGSEALAQSIAIGGWLVIALVILAISARWLLATWHARDARRWVFTAVWLYALLAPRPMAYGFVLAAIAPLALLPRFLDGSVGRLIVACVLCVHGVLVAADRPPATTWMQFTPVLLALTLWLLVLAGAEPRPAVTVEQAA